MKKLNLEVGQVVYLQPLSNAARFNKDLREAVVDKIANKFVYLVDQPGSTPKFHLVGGLEYSKNFSSQWKIWVDRVAYDEMVETERIVKRLAKVFTYSWASEKIGLEDLREIEAILDRNVT